MALCFPDAITRRSFAYYEPSYLSVTLLAGSSGALLLFSRLTSSVRRLWGTALGLAALAGGALTVFGLLVLYDRVQNHRPISNDPLDVERFVALKKAVCLGLLLAFVVTGALFGFSSLTVDAPGEALSLDFFVVFFTVLVFSDVLLVLASLTVTREYRVVFRNFTFAVVTVFLRIALVADPYPKSILGAATALFALAAAWAFDFSRPDPARSEGERRSG